MAPLTALALFLAAVAGGIVNSISGGGTFLVFPSLLLAGVPAVRANATNTIALWPGVISSAVAYRRELKGAPHVALFGAISIFGGALGALLLLKTPPALFERAVPYLLLVATLLFAFNPVLQKRLGGGRGLSHINPWRLAGVAVVQLGIALYGGYFGGGIGILMLAALGLLGMTDFHAMNAYRTFLASLTNGVAVVAFILAGAIAWPQASLMIVGGVVGGYGGARVVRRMEARVVRRIVILIGLTVSAYFFWRQFSG